MSNDINANGDVVANNKITAQGDVVIGGNKTTNIYLPIAHNYADNKDEISKTLKDLKKELSEDLGKQVDILMEALREKKGEKALGAWGKIKKAITKTGEVVNIGEKAFKLYQKIEGLLEAGCNLMP